MAKLFPKILAIESGLTSPLAQQVVDRIKAGNPDIEIIGNYQRSKTQLFVLEDMPRDAREKARWIKNKQTLILRDKQKNSHGSGLRFVHPFVSVEKAREGYQFALSVENECPFFCEFCYLQGTLQEQPIPTIFANLQDRDVLVREIKLSLLGMHIYTQIHGVQANITRMGKEHLESLIRILDKVIVDVAEDDSIGQLFDTHRTSILEALVASGRNDLEPIISSFDTLRMHDLESKFHFNNGDLNDGLAYEHLTGNSAYLVSIFNSEVMKKDGGQLLIRSKNIEVDGLLALNPNGNVIFYVSLGTKDFAKGVPNYEARIDAASRLLDAGYKIRLGIDPIIQSHTTAKQYKKMLDSIKTKMDWKNPNFERITLGMLRFNDNNIEGAIRDRHPELYGHYTRTMGKGAADEEKKRYDRDFRVETYRELANYIKEIMPGVGIKLSTEAVSIWQDVGLEWE